MNLREYFKQMDEAQRLDYATRCGTTPAYVSQVAYGHRKASGILARKLAEESGWIVSPQSLRPDIFGAAPKAA